MEQRQRGPERATGMSDDKQGCCLNGKLDLDWIIVRPPRLTNGRHTGVYRYRERIAARSLVRCVARHWRPGPDRRPAGTEPGVRNDVGRARRRGLGLGPEVDEPSLQRTSQR